MPVKRLKPLDELLHRPASALAGLTAQADEIRRLNALVHAALPADLAAQCLGVAVHGASLVIFAASSAWATRLRYHETEVLEYLARRHGLRFDRVACRIAIRGADVVPLAPPPREISPASRAVIASTADAVGDPDLAAALKRLSRRQKQ